MTVLELPDGRSEVISILQVNRAGIALIAVKARGVITVELSAANWSHIVEGDSPRSACINAERVLSKGKGLVGPLKVAVFGGPPGVARQVQHYLTGFFEEVVVGRQLATLSEAFAVAPSPSLRRNSAPESADTLHELELRISKAKLLIEKQKTIVAGLTAAALPADLASSVLKNMSESLRLLTAHWQAIAARSEKTIA
jgi:hypothetical protein